MALTAEREIALRDASLVDFFDRHQKAFAEMAAASHDYAQSYVDPTGFPLRRDDVAEILVPALTTNQPLREYLAERKLTQKYWYRDFADLILDRVWTERGE